MGTDLKQVLITKEEIDAKLAELAAKIDEEYAGQELLLVGVLKGAVMVMADLARAVSARAPSRPEWSASSRTSTPTSRAGTS